MFFIVQFCEPLHLRCIVTCIGGLIIVRHLDQLVPFVALHFRWSNALQSMCCSFTVICHAVFKKISCLENSNFALCLEGPSKSNSQDPVESGGFTEETG